MSHIFISYSKKDKSHAQRFASVLEEEGWNVWWDRSIPAGRTFDEVIQEAINDAECIMVLWSSNSNESDWVKEEAEEGKKRKILIPVLIESDVQIPLGFGRIQAADLSNWDGTNNDPEFLDLLGGVTGIFPRNSDNNIEPGTDEPQEKQPEDLEIKGNKIKVIGMQASQRDVDIGIKFFMILALIFGVALLVSLFLPQKVRGDMWEYVPSFMAGACFTLIVLVIAFLIHSKYKQS